MNILTSILDIAASILRVLEAEGRLLKRAVMNVAWALAFMAVAALLTLTAAGFLLASIYQYLAALMPPWAASFVVSLFALALALVFAVIAKRRTDDPPLPPSGEKK
jgi:hypothetical protein